MIYTCTLNPSVDYIVHLDELHVGELNRSVKTFTFPGGKGINVSRVLKRLGVDSTVSAAWRCVGRHDGSRYGRADQQSGVYVWAGDD
ncbi:PfkB family carbohydrate kinase [Geobacillus sp. TFV-3]|uniref:PfkB family carbohydrate kinase n=1 Tax=Geobacillus sp. TFV-3 TaxID=1897059 RepID=UPI002E28EE7E|nr:PfkB family carbohydrate kinase [Geobacillus sp. TFV-3]